MCASSSSSPCCSARQPSMKPASSTGNNRVASGSPTTGIDAMAIKPIAATAESTIHSTGLFLNNAMPSFIHSQPLPDSTLRACIFVSSWPDDSAVCCDVLLQDALELFRVVHMYHLTIARKV